MDEKGKLKDYSNKNRPYISALEEMARIFEEDSIRKIVERLHQNDDVDADGSAHHHTLGLRADQALPGSFGTAILRVGGIYFFDTAGDYGGFLLCDGSVYNYDDYPHLGLHRGGVPGGTFTVPTVALTGCIAYICYSSLPKADG
jgi:hypothetical protein